jgi:UDP-N-acetylmuramoylalanine--D-glutamate ligase|tara:strand:- start:2744 stop:4108 length:1365 start_codon:yes stop_codon:yes gene_type:complete
VAKSIAILVMVIGRKKVIIGLGKTGYSCARYFASQDIPFQVVDQAKSPLLLTTFQQEMPAVTVKTGGLDQKMLLQADEMVVSPGVPLATPEIQNAVAAGIKVTGDIDIFSHVVAKPLLAITGSNGKSTVTSLVGQMAMDNGLNAAVGGNLGLPALDLVSLDHDMYVLEISSFQLETTEALGAQVAAVLNLSPDHLDRYPSERHYYAAKNRIFHGCEQAVINRDQPLQLDIPEDATRWSFGSGAATSEREFGLMKRGEQTYLSWGSKPLLPGRELKIAGVHNYLNALAGLAIGLAAGFPLDGMLDTLTNFSGLEHRCEWVARIGGVDFINDSKATNVGAAVAAIKGLGETCNGRIVLIAGGDAKGADFAPLREPTKTHVRSVILMGQDADAIDDVLKDVVQVHRAATLGEALDLAVKQSNNDDMVLLSPACASLDMFDSFEQRGDLFKSLIAEYT